MTDNLENTPLVETDEEKIVQKPKKKLTEKQKEVGRANLAKGRAALAEKKKKEKEEAQKLADELIIKKAEKLTKQKANKEKQIKSIIGEVEDEPDVEERIIKKPKRKKIIYREESDSEEEVIIKPKPKAKRELPPHEPEPKPMFRINFC